MMPLLEMPACTLKLATERSGRPQCRDIQLFVFRDLVPALRRDALIKGRIHSLNVLFRDHERVFPFLPKTMSVLI